MCPLKTKKFGWKVKPKLKNKTERKYEKPNRKLKAKRFWSVNLKPVNLLTSQVLQNTKKLLTKVALWLSKTKKFGGKVKPALGNKTERRPLKKPNSKLKAKRVRSVKPETSKLTGASRSEKHKQLLTKVTLWLFKTQKTFGTAWEAKSAVTDRHSEVQPDTKKAKENPRARERRTTVYHPHKRRIVKNSRIKNSLVQT